MNEPIKKKPKVLNIYGGPGTGKSILAAGLFYELKLRGFSVEYVQEYIKDAAWEKRGPKLFAAQQYIFGKQSFRISRVADEVDLVITDGPILHGMVYTSDNVSDGLRGAIIEHYLMYDNLDILLKRSPDHPYEVKGRSQTLPEARALDDKIQAALDFYVGPNNYHALQFDRHSVSHVWNLLRTQMFFNDPTSL